MKIWKRRAAGQETAAGPVQLRGGERHPFALLDGYVPLHEPAFGLYRAIREAVPVVDAAGCTVRIINKTVSVYDTNGKLLRQESIVDYTKSNILGTYASLDNFIRQWTAEEKKESIRELLRERGIDLELMKAEQAMSDVDDFDFICHVAFDKKPLTRRERADNVKKRDFLSRYSGAAREVLEALLDRYMNTGIYEIEKTDILKLDPFAKLGKPARIAGYFGGRDGYMKAVRKLSQALYAI